MVLALNLAYLHLECNKQKAWSFDLQCNLTTLLGVLAMRYIGSGMP